MIFSKIKTGDSLRYEDFKNLAFVIKKETDKAFIVRWNYFAQKMQALTITEKTWNSPQLGFKTARKSAHKESDKKKLIDLIFTKEWAQ